MKIKLITSYYDCGDEEHQDELDLCLENNINNEMLSEIIVFSTIDCPCSCDKLTVIPTKERFKFSQAYHYAKNLVGSIILLSNSDIYFDDTLYRLLTVDFRNLMLVMTKRDVVDGTVLNNRYFHYENGIHFYNTWRKDGKTHCAGADSWAFVPPLPAEFNPDIILGTNNCDHLIVKRALECEMDVLNAFNFIRTYHLHSSNYRANRFEYDIGTNHKPYHLTAAESLPAIGKLPTAIKLL